ncbi:MAG TPA: DNA repair protein RadA [Deltaproteobacteria bacterium]|nr:DNA repair protein RadA [Deltaproteobacteria bacterium]
MAKAKRSFRCQECDHRSTKWMGRCSNCGTWNSLTEEVESAASAAAAKAIPTTAVRLADVPMNQSGEARIRTGIGELDMVLGGGLVAGSLVLLGGDPGIGKSTLLLAALDGFSRQGVRVLYASGEESLQQVRMRADRLGVNGDHLWLAAETDFSRIEAAIRTEKPRVAVIDSVQTVSVPEVTSIPGSVSQVREVAHRAMKLAKGTGIATLLVGHVTKSGELAGPKVLEHLVDTVLQFEGDESSGLRILRAIKNRFGAAGELGLFEMSDTGLKEVPDASARLLEERAQGAAGTAVLAAMEGSRPLLAEIQALVGHPGPQIPARTCVGVDRARVLMLVAVLQKAGLPLHDRDIFVNAAGGLRPIEPAADLGILAAIASSLMDRPLPQGVALFGEVGLVGEVRATSHSAARLREASRHGFRRAIAPARAVDQAPEGVGVVGVRSVLEVLGELSEDT